MTGIGHTGDRREGQSEPEELSALDHYEPGVRFGSLT